MAQRPSVESTLGSAERRQVVVCVVEENGLATEYLLHILARNKQFHIVPPEELAGQRSPVNSGPIFVLDRPGLPLPLSSFVTILRRRYPNGRYVVVDRAVCREELFQLLALGIHGFVPYPRLPQELNKAVQAVSHGQVWVQKDILEAYVQRSGPGVEPTGKVLPCEKITPRERQILDLARRRFTNKEIAGLLGIRECTVKFHLSNAFSKMLLNRRTDLFQPRPIGGFWCH